MEKGIFEQIEWIFSGIGVFILSLLIGLIHQLRKKFPINKKLNKFIGCYETYHFQVSNNNHIVKSVLSIFYRAFRIRPVVKFYSQKIFEYHGSLKVKGHNIFIQLKDISYERDIQLILKEPLGSFDCLIGLYSSVSNDGLPVSGKILIKKSDVKKSSFLGSQVLKRTMVEDKIINYLENKSKNLMVIESAE